MGAKVNITFDRSVVKESEVTKLANALPKIIVAALGENDVFAYVDESLVSVSADPIEIFIQVNINKVDDPKSLNEQIAQKLSQWKSDSGFTHPLNLNIIPVIWYSKVGI